MNPTTSDNTRKSPSCLAVAYLKREIDEKHSSADPGDSHIEKLERRHAHYYVGHCAFDDAGAVDGARRHDVHHVFIAPVYNKANNG